MNFKCKFSVPVPLFRLLRYKIQNNSNSIFKQDIFVEESSYRE